MSDVVARQIIRIEPSPWCVSWQDTLIAHGPSPPWCKTGLPVNVLGTHYPGGGELVGVEILKRRLNITVETRISCGKMGQLLDCKTVVFGRFREARRAVSVILECEPHTPLSPFSLAVFTLAPDLSFKYCSQKIRLFCSLNNTPFPIY